ncbi:MAG: hypothetical protein ACE5KE_04285 [Methanosarcinales archaeon]
MAIMQKGLLVHLDRVKTAMKEIANTRLTYAEEILDKAKRRVLICEANEYAVIKSTGSN